MGGQEILLKLLGIVVGVLRVIYFYFDALYRQIFPPPMKSIDGETILVTGAAGGIGKEICKYLVKSGSNIKLVIWDLNLTDLEKLATELKALNGQTKVYPMSVDISTKEYIDEACRHMKDNGPGSASIIFNNAGVAFSGNFLQLTDEQIEKTFQVNLMSHLWIIRQFLPEMLSINKGRLVNICSMGGLKAAQHALPYFSSKFAVNGYTEALKCELEQFQHDGIHLTTVYPYFVQTPMIRSLTLNNGGNLPPPFKRFLEPSEVAQKAVDGMRRELEFVYLPSSIPFILLTDYLMPLKLRKLLQSSHFTSFAYKDEAESKQLNLSFLETLKSK